MFVEFLGMLVLLGFAFRLLSALVGLPFAAAVVLLDRVRGRDDAGHSVAVNHAFQCVVYAVMMGLLTAAYVAWQGVAHGWIYGVTGWIWTYFMLGSNAHAKSKATSDPSGFMQTPMEAAVSQGAGIGLLIGLALFVVVYNWPSAVGVIPGSRSLILLTLRLADWLLAFWIVRIALGFVVIAYVINFGIMILFGGVLLISGAWTGMRRVLRRA